MPKYKLGVWVNYYKPNYGLDSYQLDSEIRYQSQRLLNPVLTIDLLNLDLALGH